MFFELGFTRAVVKGKYKYLAVRYPEYVINASLEERQKMLNDYNEMHRSFGGKAVNFDPTLPYGHLEMFPGGGDVEKATYGIKSGFFDKDQLYNLEDNPIEEHNLAGDDAYEEVLKEMKRRCKKTWMTCLESSGFEQINSRLLRHSHYQSREMHLF